MQIDLVVFVSVALSILILLIFLLEFIEEHRSNIVKKDITLREEKCEVCAYVYFISASLKYWRCPCCGSLNK